MDCKGFSGLEREQAPRGNGRGGGGTMPPSTPHSPLPLGGVVTLLLLARLPIVTHSRNRHLVQEQGLATLSPFHLTFQVLFAGK